MSENDVKTSEEEVSQQGADAKVDKQYEENMKKLVAVVCGKQNLFPHKKVPKDSIQSMVDELLKERKKDAVAGVKKDLSDVLDKFVQMEKDFKAKEEELKKLRSQKKKEFNEAVAKIFSRIEDIDILVKSYYESLAPGVPDA